MQKIDKFYTKLLGKDWQEFFSKANYFKLLKVLRNFEAKIDEIDGAEYLFSNEDEREKDQFILLYILLKNLNCNRVKFDEYPFNPKFIGAIDFYTVEEYLRIWKTIVLEKNKKIDIDVCVEIEKIKEKYNRFLNLKDTKYISTHC